MRLLDGHDIGAGLVVGDGATIPYQSEPAELKPFNELTRLAHVRAMNKAAFLPWDLDYTIKCRLRVDKYDNGDAHKRCKEIHGTTFDGMFCSGRYYVFYQGGL